MSLITEDRLVRALAIEVPGAAGVLERAGIDFCCGGGKSLTAACGERSLEVAAILTALEAAAQDHVEPEDAHWQRAPLPELAAHIVSHHHAYVRAETPRLLGWLDKVVTAHGERHPEVAQIRQSFTAMTRDMSQHMAKEELILFPAIIKLAAPPEHGRTLPTLANIAAPIRTMVMEHEHSGNDLADLRRASGEYTPPMDACATYRVLYQGLAEFDRQLRQHIHLENNILFPRALKLEHSAAGEH